DPHLVVFQHRDLVAVRDAWRDFGVAEAGDAIIAAGRDGGDGACPVQVAAPDDVFRRARVGGPVQVYARAIEFARQAGVRRDVPGLGEADVVKPDVVEPVEAHVDLRSRARVERHGQLLP